MPALDFRILLIIPLALAETFLLWTLWNLIQQSSIQARQLVSKTGGRPGIQLSGVQ